MAEKRSDKRLGAVSVALRSARDVGRCSACYSGLDPEGNVVAHDVYEIRIGIAGFRLCVSCLEEFSTELNTALEPYE